MDSDRGPSWQEVIDTVTAAWPGETPVWSETPLELVTRLIDERDDLIQSVTKAVRGIRAELADETQGPAETLAKIEMRIAELAPWLSVSVPCSVSG